MKFEKITDTKIRIILSLQDMESNNITAENVLSYETQAHLRKPPKASEMIPIFPGTT